MVKGFFLTVPVGTKEHFPFRTAGLQTTGWDRRWATSRSEGEHASLAFPRLGQLWLEGDLLETTY